MAITKKDVEYVARLARLYLTEEEKESYTTQLDHILSYIEKLNELNTDNVPPTSHPFFTRTVWRNDKMIPPTHQEPILKNAPESEENFFKVRKVIE